MRFKDYFKESAMRLYRGKSVYNKNGHYWSIDREWARQFTQSGLDSEIEARVVDGKTLLRLNPLPQATDEGSMDNAIKKGMMGGYKGIIVDEGMGQPNSVYLF
jgi:hypothetical protein